MKKKLLLTVFLGFTFSLFAVKNPASTTDISIPIVELWVPSITSQPEGGTIYVGESIDISITATDYTTIQWEFSTDNGSTWNTINDNATFSGSTTETLSFTPDSELVTGISFRAVLTDASNDTVTSSEALVIVSNYTQIPDPNFEARLEALGYDDISGDGQVPTSLIRNVTSLNVDAQNISDITGIEAFTRLDELRADNNNLTNPDFSQNTVLRRLFLRNNNITVFDLSANTRIQRLLVEGNGMTDLNLTGLTILDNLFAAGNNLTEIDLSTNTRLKVVGLGTNNLSRVDMRNGNNTNVTIMQLTNNPNLYCVEVDDVAYSTANWTNIDAQTGFSEVDCYVPIPDANFEAALDALGYDDISGDGQVPISLIETVTSLSIGSSGISDLTGIANFTALETLLANNNSISTADLSSNANLLTVSLRNNGLTSLDVTGSPNLGLILVENNNLTSIDVTNNPLLTRLWAQNNSLNALDVSNNPILRAIGATNSNLSSLDVSNIPTLEQLYVEGNNLTELDLSNNPALVIVGASSNNLSSFNMQNGNNVNVTNFTAGNNPNLTCILVDDAAYSTTNWTNIDATTFFSETSYCNYTQIPDMAFEVALESLGYDDISGDGQVPTELIEGITSLDVGSEGINDMTGIEAFVALQTLTADDNQFESINLSTLTQLTQLNLQGTDLSSIDLSNNTLLTILTLEETQLTTVDVSANELLEELDLKDIGVLTNITFGNNIALRILDASFNDIATLDLSALTALEQILVQSNELTTLNIRSGNNTNLASLNASGNPNLSCIFVDDATYATTNFTNIDATTTFSDTDYCDYTSIPDANFEARLETLGYDDISGDGQVPTALIENITTLNIEGSNTSTEDIVDLTGIEDFASLTSLNARFNFIVTADLSSNTLLEDVNLRGNELTSINVSGLTSLEVLYCHQNRILTVDLSTNTALKDLNVSDNSLSGLDVSNNTALEILTIQDIVGIQSLSLTNNVNISELTITDTQLESLDLSQLSNLTDVNLIANSLTHLNIKNGANTNIVSFNTGSNRDLICILVDDAVYSTTNWTNIHPNSSFSDTFCRYTAIPDTNFEAALAAFDDTPNDGQVPTALIEVVTSLDVDGNAIANFSGIEDFTALTSLNIANNSATTLDVSSLTALELLRVDGNSLTSLDVSNNTALVELYCSFISGITAVDISNNTLLETAHISHNSIANIDVSNNILLTELRLRNNGLTSLDISNNTALQVLKVDDNSTLTSLDVTTNTALEDLGAVDCSLTEITGIGNTALQFLYLRNNNFTSLNLSNNGLLQIVDLYNNQLSNLNLKNGNNTAIGFIDSRNNPDLNCIIVDDVLYSTTNWNFIDAQTSFSDTFCRYTAIPGINFEAALEALGYDDISADGQVPTTLIENITLLNVSDNSISDLTGIEDFVLLETLYAGDNALTALDVSSLTELKSLRVAYNQLTSLDLSSNSQLNDLNVSFNNLSSLNIQNGNNSNLSQFSALNNTNLNCILVDDSAFAEANFTNIDATTSFSDTDYCRYTAIPDANFEAQLEALGYDDISSDGQVPTALIETVTTLIVANLNISDATGIEDFTALTTLRINSNNLTAIDVSNNVNLETLYLHNNALTTIDLSTLVVLEDFRIYNNPLTSLDVSTNTLLRSIDASDTNIASINLSNNTLLEDVQLYDCAALTTVDVSGVTLLRNLYLNDTNVTALDLSSNTALTYLGIDGNTAITSLDLTNNNAISSLDVDDCTVLSSITFGPNTSLSRVDLTNTALTSLDVSSLTNLQELIIQNTFIETLDVSANQALEELNTSNANLNLLFIQNGNNTNITSFDTTNNPNLTCILVDDAAYSTTNWTNIDNQTSFSDMFCRYTAIPDPIFEAVLDSLGYDDISADGQVPTALIEVVTSLDLTLLNINDITGIQDFIALESLVLPYTNVVDVNVSGLLNLQTLNVSNTSSLTSLDVSGAIALSDFQAYNNPSLTGALDLTTNTNLQIVNIYNTSISTLDIRNGNNTTITVFDATNNSNISCILVDDAAYSTTNWTQIDAGTTFNEFDCVVPEITCPDNITVDSQTGICGADITIPLPLVIDNVDCIQNDDLETYSEGLLLGQGGDWDTWNPNTISESGNITTEQARSGTKSLKIEGTPRGGPQDMAFNLGNRDFGAYELTYHLYVPAGNTAYSNTQKTENAGQQFASQIIFGSDGTGLYNHSGSAVEFNYPQDTWFEMKVLINIDADHSEVYLDGTFIASHPFSDTRNGTGGLNTLGSVTFYPVTLSSDPNPNATPLFYVDDLSLCAVAVNDFNNSTDASDEYPPGTTDVVWTYTDEGRNIATCTQTVIVNDIHAPEVIMCPEDITTCETTVNYEIPLANDNCITVPLSDYTFIGSFDNKDYYISNARSNTPDAFISAEAQNGFVATIISEEHNDWLRNKLDDLGEDEVIIGYTDRDVEDTFVWHSGSTSTYTNWNTNEPNDSGSAGEDYTFQRTDGTWNDISATTSRKFILEISKLEMTQIAGLPSGSEFPIGTTTNIFEASDAAGNTVTCSFDVTVEAICNTDFSLELDVFLQGAALNPNTGEEELMRDDLREGGFIPTRSPYSDMLTCEPTVFDVTGNDAIVDWIWIELRDATDNTIVSYTQSALLQRDGDVVDVDGVSPLDFSTTEDTYYVAVHHRNHLGIMTLNAITFMEGSTTNVNFKDDNETFGSNPQTDFGLSGVFGMWCGNANSDTVIQYSGTSPDTPNILSEVLNDAGNFLNFPTYSLSGYNVNDANMDGVIQYSGTNPDTPFILQNILAHPGNFLNFSTYQIIEQLPENINNTNE
jgi:Leucine-rich repeat (LRR) protein